MKELLPHLLLFVLPLTCANILHMICVKYNFLSPLAKPVSEKYFGSGKTWRGFFLLPIFCAVFAAIFNCTDLLRSIGIGALLGLIYMLAELPNSFIKRKMGIRTGATNARHPFVQLLIDKLDSLLALCVVYYFLVPISLITLSVLLFLSLVIHLVFSFLLYWIGLKKNF